MSKDFEDPDGAPVSDREPLGVDKDRAELMEARVLILTAAAVFNRWHRRLEAVSARLPDPQYDLESDDPINLSAAIQGLLQGVLHDEIAEINKALKTLAQWVDDPQEWRPATPG